MGKRECALRPKKHRGTTSLKALEAVVRSVDFKYKQKPLADAWHGLISI